ncbi:MAG: hypothetical protein Q8R18_01635 [bacterium]|nr:hypothetical protein [bacterium]
MYIPKQYGKSKVEKCPFCEQQATTTNKQGLIVCRNHSQAVLGEMKCICKSFLELKTGKWGPFFLCISCGAMNLKKVFAINHVVDVSANEKSNYTTEKTEYAKKPFTLSQNKPTEFIQKRKNPTEITIRSDDPRYFD